MLYTQEFLNFDSISFGLFKTRLRNLSTLLGYNDSIFFDIPLVIKLAFLDTYVLEMLIHADSGVLATICFILLLISYFCILLAVCHQSRDRESKALSTCTAHITVVMLFFGLISSSLFFHSTPLGWASSLLYFMQSSHHY